CVTISQSIQSLLLLPSYSFPLKDTSPTEIYTLSLHDALPISDRLSKCSRSPLGQRTCTELILALTPRPKCTRMSFWPRRESQDRSEEHTSELQSRRDLVCRLLLEKKKKK